MNTAFNRQEIKEDMDDTKTTWNTGGHGGRLEENGETPRAGDRAMVELPLASSIIHFRSNELRLKKFLINLL